MNGFFDNLEIEKIEELENLLTLLKLSDESFHYNLQEENKLIIRVYGEWMIVVERNENEFTHISILNTIKYNNYRELNIEMLIDKLKEIIKKVKVKLYLDKTKYIVADQDFVEKFDAILTFIKLADYKYYFENSLQIFTNLCSEIYVQSSQSSQKIMNDKIDFFIYNSNNQIRITSTFNLTEDRILSSITLIISSINKPKQQYFLSFDEYISQLKEYLIAFEEIEDEN